jgi:ribosomal subunit interface protein
MHTELKLHHIKAEQLLLGHVERRFSRALARFGDKLGRITVRIGVSGRGRTDTIVCRISADIHSFGFIVAEASDANMYTALDRCTARFARRCASRCMRQRSARAARFSIRSPWSLPIAS